MDQFDEEALKGGIEGGPQDYEDEDYIQQKDSKKPNNSQNFVENEIKGGNKPLPADPRIDNTDPNRMTLDQALISSGLGWVHLLLFLICGSGWLFDGAGLSSISFTIPKMSAEWNLTPMWAGTLGSSIYVGMFFGSLLGGMCSDRFGRKIVFLSGFFCNSLFGMFSAIAPEYYSFFGLRMISGIGLGAAIPVSLTWALEFSAIKKRGALSAFMNIFWAFGAITCCAMAWIMVPNIGWRWLIFSVNFIGIFVVLAGIFVPESPRWLYTRGRTEEALNIINMFRAWNFQRLIMVPLIPHDEAFKMIKTKQIGINGIEEDDEHAIDNEPDEDYVPMEGNAKNPRKIPKNIDQKVFQEKNLGFFDQFFILFSDKYATSTLLLWCMWWLLSYGSGGFQFLIPQVFEKIHSKNPYPNTMAVVGVSFVGYLLALFLMDFFPRKMILFLAYFVMGVVSLFVGIWSNIWYMMGVAMILASLNGIPWSTIYVYTPEVYPTACRTTGMGICSSFNRLASCVAPILGQQLLSTSYFLPFVTFGGALLLGSICTLFLPTETFKSELKDGVGEEEESEKKGQPENYTKLKRNQQIAAGSGESFSERIL